MKCVWSCLMNDLGIHIFNNKSNYIIIYHDEVTISDKVHIVS